MTKEPVKHNDGTLRVDEEGQDSLSLIIENESRFLARMEWHTGVDKANFDRLAQCWNACLGIPTERINGVIGAEKHNHLAFQNLQAKLDEAERLAGHWQDKYKDLEEEIKSSSPSAITTSLPEVIAENKVLREQVKQAEEGAE